MTYRRVEEALQENGARQRRIPSYIAPCFNAIIVFFPISVNSVINSQSQMYGDSSFIVTGIFCFDKPDCICHFKLLVESNKYGYCFNVLHTILNLNDSKGYLSILCR